MIAAPDGVIEPPLRQPRNAFPSPAGVVELTASGQNQKCQIVSTKAWVKAEAHKRCRVR
jgi:hypothetical protein